MSTYFMEVRNKTTGETSSCVALDYYFGKRNYGYRVEGKGILNEADFNKNYHRVEQETEEEPLSETLTAIQVFLLTDPRASGWEVRLLRLISAKLTLERVDERMACLTVINQHYLDTDVFSEMDAIDQIKKDILKLPIK